MEKKMLLFVLLGGCVLAAPSPLEAQEPFEAPLFHLPSERAPFEAELQPVWHPSSHPVGSLLLDHERHLWMVTSYGVRQPVTGDDVLGEIGLGFEDAVSMTPEEEECVAPSDTDEWGPGNIDWQPIWGPDEEDRGPFVLDWGRMVRSRTSTEALDSWGYYSRWTDYYDGGLDDWARFTDASDPVAIRDGTLVQTELTTYYVVHGRSYAFLPASLAVEAGYNLEHALQLRDARLRDLAPAAFSLERAAFELCPAIDPAADR